MNSLLREIDSDINIKCSKEKCYHNHTINVTNVSDAIKLLKSNKSDGTNGQSSNHIVNACVKLHVFLSLLFQSMFVHG